MTMLEMQEKLEIQELVNRFANLADEKDAKSQGDLFLENGMLEFQMGFDGEIQNIIGREELVKAFAATINPCIAVYHINGQHIITLNGDEATGTAYCQATLVNDVDGKKIVTVNDVRYSDIYKKVDGKWYLEKRRTTFLISEKHEMNV
ncbi:nuclear transport factor 2 family protein [Clostridium estertheticum]|uniref:nuclear transport factor 2 family protein n=1 Tax=Clostridium estertheticum TaxID=238834 RepID=UPI001C0B59C5|nr:nuclear transport factor 2 family protein [Clostridium estertheticum]MBU3202409.1 nuclear transport factor 2 family protein [Clostridium estertheticum]WAG66620.1 nuclear transport factor 2 family protein [Clostridium estertheticum]